MSAQVVKAAGVVMLVLLAACSEKPQTLGAAGNKADAAAWATSDAAKPGFSAAGWKGGDKASWEAQIRSRNQAQNDYLR